MQTMYFFQVAHGVICRLGERERQQRFEGIHHTGLEISRVITVGGEEAAGGRQNILLFCVAERETRRQAYLRVFGRCAVTALAWKAKKNKAIGTFTGNGGEKNLSALFRNARK